MDVKGKGLLTSYLLSSKHHECPVVTKQLIYADLTDEKYDQ